ncbi:MAG: energy transducer TonB [Sphingobacteriaceae bacterium]|jgi:TonB family protein|nr:energy transducer TonB [Sphingobacteriaceae bacterium]
MMFPNLIISILTFFSAFLFDGRPEFKGGAQKLNYFITSNMVYPEFAKQNCLQGTIQVNFKLGKTGKVYDSFVQKGFGVDLDKEALRIVRLTSGKWVVPAGYDTTVAIVLPINFSLQEYKCEQRSPEDINAAIAAYQARESMTKAVTNFYQKKYAGQADIEDEAKIMQLKVELGFDDAFISRVLKQAQTKIKQGDKESACEDFNFIHNIGSVKADKLIAQYCQ